MPTRPAFFSTPDKIISGFEGDSMTDEVFFFCFSPHDHLFLPGEEENIPEVVVKAVFYFGRVAWNQEKRRQRTFFALEASKFLAPSLAATRCTLP